MGFDGNGEDGVDDAEVVGVSQGGTPVVGERGMREMYVPGGLMMF